MSDARILVVDDEANIRELLDEILSEEGYQVTTAEDAAHAREARRGTNFDLTLLDIWMPDTDGITLLKEWADSGSLGPVVMMSGHGTVDTAVEATRLGALDFIEKPVSLSQLLRTVTKVLEQRPAPGIIRSMGQSHAPVGKSAAMRTLREKLQAAARHDTHLLITGEPGSGRTEAVRYLASLCRGTGVPLAIVEGAQLTDAGADAILFGSAGDNGAFARAAGGILFIRDIGNASVAAQRLILSALAGDARQIQAGAGQLRLVASAESGFELSDGLQPELANEITLVVIRVPALRDRSEDVPELLRFYVDAFVDRERLPFRRFSIAAQNRLRNYPWPGNVRELQHLVKQMLVLGGSDDIELAEVETELAADSTGTEPLIKKDLLAMPLREAREHFERAYLKQQLQLCGGKVGQLAKRVGMERTHLYRKLRALGVDFRQLGNDDD